MTEFHGFDVLEPLLGEVFIFVHDGGQTELTLTDAESRGMTPTGVPAGVLTFKGPREPMLPQATYDVVHPDLGEFAMFIVPVAQGDQGTVYEAVFA